jgi:hypothetical protein
MRDDIRSLELNLERLGAAMTYPPTPDIATVVARRVEGGIEATQPPAVRWVPAGPALAALVVAAAIVVAVASPAQEAVADLFDRINIFEADVPEDLPLDIRGEQVSLEEAETRLGRRILLPSASDGSTLSPERVIIQDFRPTSAHAAALFFETDRRVPFILMETDSGLGKGLADSATAEPVSDIGDGQAFWLEGTRLVQLYDDEGNFIQESQRRAEANTLVWMEGDLILRLEGDLTRVEATEIARSVR